jgi:hypothetical protein
LTVPEQVIGTSAKTFDIRRIRAPAAYESGRRAVISVGRLAAHLLPAETA